MAAQNVMLKTEQEPLTGSEILGLRVSAMINSPIAQLGRRVRIHRLDTDEEEAWGTIMDLLAETDGLQMDFDDEGSVILQWEKPGDMDAVFDREEGGAATADEEAAPF